MITTLFTQKKITADTKFGDVLHEWAMPEYETYDRGKRWYILMAIVGTLLVVYGLFTGDFLFTLIIVLAAIILFLQDKQDPVDVPFAITEIGIVLGDRLYEFSDLGAFYIIYKPPKVKVLFFETKSILRPTLRILLKDENPIDVRKTLLEYMDEDLEKEDEPASDTFARDWQIH
ncbi:MAG: hypothetical protein HOE80_00740 [Candidatus Magasanikbacteria bacterium]|jgi:hypothetical protein|nr:hypothetical protein [Candidatus Magasanikbacteria bacterium]MBT4071233.1 hypothetical protein [Candidatus Magasanikbacteria bacterium]